MANRDFSDGPAMVMSPRSENVGQSNDSTSGLSQQEVSSLHSDVYFNHSTSWTPPASATSISTNPSRKRSRDFSEYISHSNDSGYPLESVNTPASIPEEPMCFGDGMTMRNRSAAQSISGKSQTSIWGEDKADEAGTQGMSAIDGRELAPTRKVVRLDPSAPMDQMDDTVNGFAPDSPPKSSKQETTIDGFTYALGIGWTKVSSEDPDMEAAARGWARYLENHYPSHIQDAQILLKSKGLSAYLVASRQGFYLFSEDLSEGRLVGRSWDVTLNNLRTHPIAFEGEMVLCVNNSQTPENTYFMNGNIEPSPLKLEPSGGHNASSQSAQMEMD